MENYVCPQCWRQIQYCTCELYPPWHLVMIDVGIQEVIRNLNNKGYHTDACCESHFGDGCSVYVAFPYNYNLPVPEGFTFAKTKPSISYVYKKAERENKELFEKVKAEKLKILIEWSEALPANPNMFKR